MATRRIAAIVLPQLACELVRQRGAGGPGGSQPDAASRTPLGVILEPGDLLSAPGEGASGRPGDDVQATALLDVVDDEARRYGVRPGQRVTEAAALVAGLVVQRVTYGELDAALGRVAEVALALGGPAAIRLGLEGGETGRSSRAKKAEEPRREQGAAPFDTVWLDITGSAHLIGGEAAVIDELVQRIGALGHRVRVAIADGPRLAQALARWGGITIAPEGRGGQALATLPVRALPIDADTASWLVRLGVLLVGDLTRLIGRPGRKGAKPTRENGSPGPQIEIPGTRPEGPANSGRAAAAARLGKRAAEVLDLIDGRDPTPLIPYAAPRTISEDASFEDGVESTEALLFVLRGMTSRAAARLAARGEACLEMEVSIFYDRAIARLRLADSSSSFAAEPRAEHGVTGDDQALRFRVELPAPLAREGDLLRALRAKLERLELAAPAVALRLVLPRMTPAPQIQLDLSRDVPVNPDALPALLAELSAEIGADRVGVLAVATAHRPEARSTLVPAGKDRKSPSTSPGAILLAGAEPTRLLPVPIPLGRVARGDVVAVSNQLYAIERRNFAMRLDAVEWWTFSPISRDYSWAWLATGSPGREPSPGQRLPLSTCGEALIFVDRTTGEGFLQGWRE